MTSRHPIRPPETVRPQVPVRVPHQDHGPHAGRLCAGGADVVRKHAADFDPAALEMRASKEGNWLSVTATVNATSREQLDELYRELVAHPMVKMVL